MKPRYIDDILGQGRIPDRIVGNEPDQVMVLKISFFRQIKRFPDEPWMLLDQLLQHDQVSRIDRGYCLAEQGIGDVGFFMAPAAF
jgi:hypothetical protein